MTESNFSGKLLNPSHRTTEILTEEQSEQNVIGATTNALEQE
jgi:hypothetical protein